MLIDIFFEFIEGIINVMFTKKEPRIEEKYLKIIVVTLGGIGIVGLIVVVTIMVFNK